jgi:hypothetical protein
MYHRGKQVDNSLFACYMEACGNTPSIYWSSIASAFGFNGAHVDFVFCFCCIPTSIPSGCLTSSCVLVISTGVLGYKTCGAWVACSISAASYGMDKASHLFLSTDDGHVMRMRVECTMNTSASLVIRSFWRLGRCVTCG